MTLAHMFLAAKEPADVKKVMYVDNVPIAHHFNINRACTRPLFERFGNIKTVIIDGETKLKWVGRPPDAQMVQELKMYIPKDKDVLAKIKKEAKEVTKKLEVAKKEAKEAANIEVAKVEEEKKINTPSTNNIISESTAKELMLILKKLIVLFEERKEKEVKIEEIVEVFFKSNVAVGNAFDNLTDVVNGLIEPDVVKVETTPPETYKKPQPATTFPDNEKSN